MVSLRGQKKPGSLPDWSPLRAKISDEHPSPVYPSGSLSYCNTTPSRVTSTLSLVNLCLFTPSWVRKFEYSPSLLPSNLVGSCKANQLCLKSFKFLVDLLKFLPSVSVFESYIFSLITMDHCHLRSSRARQRKSGFTEISVFRSFTHVFQLFYLFTGKICTLWFHAFKMNDLLFYNHDKNTKVT